MLNSDNVPNIVHAGNFVIYYLEAAIAKHQNALYNVNVLSQIDNATHQFVIAAML